MTTATDWDDATWTDTGEMAAVTDVTSAAVDQIDIDTANGNPLGVNWVPPRLPARSWARIVGSRSWTGDHPGMRDVLAHMDVGTDAMYHEASMIRDHGVQIAAHHRELPPLTARDVTGPLVAAYERERDALIAGLRGREYGGHVYDDEHGFVSAGPPHRLPPPPPDDRQGTDPDPTPEQEAEWRVPPPSPPDDRVQRMTRRVNGRLRTSQPETPAETPTPRRSWWRRNDEWLIAGAVAVAWAIGIGLTIWLTGGP